MIAALAAIGIYAVGCYAVTLVVLVIFVAEMNDDSPLWRDLMRSDIDAILRWLPWAPLLPLVGLVWITRGIHNGWRRYKAEAR